MTWREDTINPFDTSDPAIAVDATGRRHVVFAATLGFFLAYETCNASCGTAGGWSYASVEPSPDSLSDGFDVGIAIDGAGHLHVSHVGPNGLRYSRCDSACSTYTNWRTVGLPLVASGGDYRSQTAIAVDSTGRVHIAIGLRYADCATNCLSDASWHFVTPPGSGERVVSLATDPGGRVFLVAGPPHMHFGMCAGACDIAANWDTVTIDPAVLTTPGGFHALAVEPGGRIHVAYLAADSPFANQFRIRYAVCDSACGTATSWRIRTVATGTEAAITVDVGGTVHMLFRDSQGVVRYLPIH
jgi:hypothetical protein